MSNNFASRQLSMLSYLQHSEYMPVCLCTKEQTCVAYSIMRLSDSSQRTWLFVQRLHTWDLSIYRGVRRNTDSLWKCLHPMKANIRIYLISVPKYLIKEQRSSMKVAPWNFWTGSCISPAEPRRYSAGCLSFLIINFRIHIAD